ncbi:MAG: nucleotidyl transferase AbiEii/AbiGii toxin family protein [Acidaminococcaceae bacterium]|nr:nucleotidyl transferase AbiEii/AbiGii toxin family protein [Acidaminococcaceae bacterium]
MENTVLEQMLRRYDLKSDYDRKNAMKEIMQEIVLCGLSRGGFFKKASFYGGTALRMFYGLDRFSEDLDFSLMTKNPSFSLENYFAALQKEVNSFGLNVTIEEKEKTIRTDIQSAFVKGNTREHLLLFYTPEIAGRVPANETIKIKFEIDIKPPPFATYERKYRLLPAPYEVNMYDEPSLFAGKIHAVICRGWKSRVKGRDLYDYVFYLGRGTKVNLAHLRARLVDSGYIDRELVCGLQDVKDMLFQKFTSIDYEQAKQDVLPFIKNQSSLALWSADFFKQITELLDARS